MRNFPPQNDFQFPVVTGIINYTPFVFLHGLTIGDVGFLHSSNIIKQPKPPNPQVIFLMIVRGSQVEMLLLLLLYYIR